jgi:hypothetical protein
MNSQTNSQPEFDYSVLKFDRFFWMGKHELPWLAEKGVIFIVHAGPAGISDDQRKSLGFAYSLPHRSKTHVEEFLFTYYQSEVFGTLTGGESITPRISRPAEIWSLVRTPGVEVPPDRKLRGSCVFVLSLECCWDPEHGLAIVFDENGAPVDIGGQGEFF